MKFTTGASTRFDGLVWAQAGDGDIAPLSDLVAASKGKPTEQVVVQTLIVESANPLDVIHPSDPQAYEVRSVGGISVMRVEDESGPFVLGAWTTPYEGVFHLVGSIPATDARWEKVKRWVTNAAPHAVRCLLDHVDFIDIGTALAEFGDVEVQRMTGRMRADQSSYSRGFPAHAGETLRPDHQEIVAEAEAAGVAVRTLGLHVGDVVDVHIRRMAGATYYHGDFEVFEHIVLGRLATAAHRRRELLSSRERHINEPVRRPIQVRLASPVFTDAKATGEVITELASSRDVSFAVMHRNPYLHVVVTDNSDGSNYDLFVTQADAIEIHPGFRASLGSLTRISQGLGERFEAIDLRETPDPEPVSFYDLVDG